MKYVDFFGHKVSKLIVGDNPFNGHSYITDTVAGKEMSEFYTEDKILEAMHKMEELGVNTMLPLADPYIIRILQHYRSNGGKMNFIFQPYMPLNQDVSMIQMATVEPIGIYHQGTTTDYNFETGKKELTIELIKKYKSMGIPVGVATHRSDVIEASEREDWGADFYLRCMYNARRNREGVESGFLTGKTKQGLIFRPDDRAEVLNDLQGIEKPIIAYKLFAGGQMLVNKTPEEKRAAIKDAYNTVFTALKPNDFGAIGVFQKYEDQLTENISIFNEWAEENEA
ncbi:MAG: hypothetical protein J6A69_00055 [Clostridia bacterium]|nr:hypothetical protein [Clostridia bacterium]